MMWYDNNPYLLLINTNANNHNKSFLKLYITQRMLTLPACSYHCCGSASASTWIVFIRRYQCDSLLKTVVILRS